MEWARTLDIPLKASEELVSIDLMTDLPDDPMDLKTLLIEENSDKEHWLTIAVAYCNQGKLKDGIELIKVGLENFEGSDKSNFYTFLTWCYLKLSKECVQVEENERLLNLAEESLKGAITLDPTWVGNMLATVDLYYQRGLYDKALETSDLFVKSIQMEELRSGKQSRINCMFLLMRAKLLYQKKNFAGALKLFQELLVINPVLNPDPRLGIGLCAWQLKDYKMALEAWNRSLELQPNNTNIKILINLGKFQDTITNSQNDQTFKENFTNCLLDLNNLFNDVDGKDNIVLLTLLQNYYYFKNDFDKVIKIYDDKILPRAKITNPIILSDSTFWTARAYYAKEDYRKSFNLFQESLKNNEDNLLARFGIGQSQLKTNLVEESIITFENLYKSNENLQELNYVLGLLYAEKFFKQTDSKAILSKELRSLNVKALQFLEKYINLTTAKKNQLVITKAYLVVAELYEHTNQYKKSLEYLSRAADEIDMINTNDENNEKIPFEILNNLGCYYFISGEFDKAKEYFEKAKASITDDSSVITLDFNIARTIENDDLVKSGQMYKSILEKHPNYIAAKMREIYCKFVNENNTNGNLREQVDSLINMCPDNLEVRSFYSWFLKNDNSKTKKENDMLSTQHNKDTVVKYDSHDLYALISLANLYCIIAREAKRVNTSKEDEKSKHSYLKALQLYQKVLQIDPLNVFAAQGIAIVFVESKRMGPALEILRKLRDSITNEDVHINLANCLLEMNEFAKASEAYEIILKKYPDYKNKAYILNLLGRSWFSRGMKDKNVSFLQKSLEKIKLAIDATEVNERSKNFLSGLKYNSALLKFQIAETLRRSSIKLRNLADLRKSLVELNEAVETLKEILQIDAFKTISKDEIEQRIQIGETTLKTTLERCIKEQEEYENAKIQKLDEARKILEEEKKIEAEKKAEMELQKQQELAKKAEEYRKLQDDAQKLIQERDVGLVDESNADEDYNEDGKKKRKRKSGKSNDNIDRNDNNSDSEDEMPVKKRSNAKTYKSSEIVEDSDEEEVEAKSSDSEDGLF